MTIFEIIAHRGLTSHAPENTIEAFQLALDHKADGVEMDVRLSGDGAAVVYHYTYLTGFTNTTGLIFDFTLDALREVQIPNQHFPERPAGHISTLKEVLDAFAGKLALEIEIKGPEPEAIQVIANILQDYRQHWPMLEITSFEPALLLAIQKICPGIICDLLFPRSEAWMGLDVVQYLAVQRARLANARAVHLHPSQLTREVVHYVRKHGIEIHAWDVNTEEDLRLCQQLNLPRICTDHFKQALDFRNRLSATVSI